MNILLLLLTLSLNLESSSSYCQLAKKEDEKKVYSDTSSMQLTDTIKYLQEIIKRKNQYIGKELNVLMKDLTMQPRFFLYDVGGIDHNPDYTKSASLYFHYFNGEETQKRIESHIISGRLVIRWLTVLNIDSVVAYSRKNGRHWNKAAEEFYGNKIIKDIDLY